MSRSPKCLPNLAIRRIANSFRHSNVKRWPFGSTNHQIIHCILFYFFLVVESAPWCRVITMWHHFVEKWIQNLHRINRMNKWKWMSFFRKVLTCAAVTVPVNFDVWWLSQVVSLSQSSFGWTATTMPSIERCFATSGIGSAKMPVRLLTCRQLDSRFGIHWKRTFVVAIIAQRAQPIHAKIEKRSL